MSEQAPPTSQPKPPPVSPEPAPTKKGPIGRFLEKHGRKLWWLHSFWALVWGMLFMVLAGKGYSYSRFLLISVCIVWVVIVLLFRFVGSGEDRRVDTKGQKVRFYAMTYVLKNLYQGMLFFLLPYYWQSSTVGTPNFYFVVFLASCALVSTLDIVFDNYLMKWKTIASGFYVFTLFACLNVALPSILPDIASIWTLLLAGVLSMAAFLLMHFPARLLREKVYISWLVAIILVWLTSIYMVRKWIPPVPMYLTHAAVGPALVTGETVEEEKGMVLEMEVKALHRTVMDRDLFAITEVVAPGGLGEKLRHRWRQLGPNGATYGAGTVVLPTEKRGVVRVQSKLPIAKVKEHGEDTTGRWIVDVLTGDGRLVGRTGFRVTN
ncbi:MAG: hypothetical protein CMH54_09320 [Myxococcales bacterium]|nr:hypothetical protein [Myxococcales bacterium]